MIKFLSFISVTVLGFIMALWAVFQDVRLDWPETALLFGAICFATGLFAVWQMIKEHTEGLRDE